jgi:hypothetical protein
MRQIDRIYRTFEEFEREELRRMETLGTSVNDLMAGLFDDDLEGAAQEGRRQRSAGWDEEED